jgi:hypothetical protein
MRRSRSAQSSNAVGGGGNGIVDAMQRIAESEARKLHIAELAIVTSVFPHSSDNDTDNYECNIRLKDKDVEIRKVPVATQHIGLANIPHVGDLVLVTFVNGDINSPIIIGRLYNDADRPPTTKEEEIVYKPPYADKKSLRRINISLPSDVVSIDLHDDRISATAGKSAISANSDGEIAIRSIKDPKTGQGATTSFDNTSMVLDVKGSGGGCVIKLDGQGITIETDMNIAVHSKGNTSVTCDGDYSLTATNIKMNSKAATKLEVGSSLDVSAASAKIEATGGEIGIKSSAAANVESTGPLTIKSSAAANVESTGPLTIKSSAAANVESTGPLAIRGAIVNIN